MLTLIGISIGAIIVIKAIGNSGSDSDDGLEYDGSPESIGVIYSDSNNASISYGQHCLNSK